MHCHRNRQQTAGNGLATTRTFDPTTGRLTGVSTGSGGAVQNLSYTYDMLGNPLSRSDASTTVSESFVYDALSRLTQSTVSLSTPLVKTFSYSAVGNLLSKSDVGTYSYPAPGSPQPHAVMSTSGGVISATFTYDANGNQTSGLGRSISYSSYNKPSSITQGTQTISFLDDTEHQRFQQVTPQGTTLYIAGFGALAELSGAGTMAAKWTDYLSVGNARVGMRVLQTASETLNTRYFHTDHLGSISVITDENGNVLERLSYDAWGKRRFPNGTDDPSDSITSQTTRGFTGEEELQTANLVHLNGRVYDSLLARFTSADPTVTDPTNPQGWNRYSYVGNDPLAFTDPNGFSWLSGFFNSIGKFFTGIVHSITHFLQTNTIARTILQLGLNIILSPLGPIGAAISAVVVTGLTGGNLSQILKAGLIAGVTAFGFDVVGAATNSIATGQPFDLSAAHFQPAFGSDAYAFNIAGHALVGCGSAAASGGNCGAGALSGGIGSAVGPLTNKLFPLAGSDLDQRIGGTILEATAGGFASVAGGGKFANGAVTAASGYLYNELGNNLQRGYGYAISNSVPPDAVLYQAPDGSTFYAPANADFGAVYAYGRSISSLWNPRSEIGAAIGQGGFFDFQRSGDIFYTQYTNASNYGVGVLMNGAGYSWTATELIAGGYASLYSQQGWTSQLTTWWRNGYTAASTGQLPRPPITP